MRDSASKQVHSLKCEVATKHQPPLFGSSDDHQQQQQQQQEQQQQRRRQRQRQYKLPEVLLHSMFCMFLLFFPYQNIPERYGNGAVRCMLGSCEINTTSIRIQSLKITYLSTSLLQIVKHRNKGVTSLHRLPGRKVIL